MTVVIVSTGGTIASTEDDGEDGAAPELTAENLIASVPELGDVASLRTRDFSNVPSAYFEIEQMAELASEIEAYDADEEVDGVVVTQGTDVLEESAYFVDCWYDGETPVVFTGAMRNPSLPSPDGPANLLASVRTAADESAEERGALVCFNDRIHAAADVTKTNSMNVDTFRSPEVGPLGAIDEDRVVWFRERASRPPALDPDPDRITNDVHAVTVTADMPIAQIEAAADAEALCFAATGAGHIPPSIIEPLESVAGNGVPLIATTRCPEGRLARHTYGFRGSEETLRKLDCYFASENVQKTRIETIVALAADSLDVVFERP
ncbi:asparaginase [Natrarchaeobius oligotrophus]|uniref:L-asparaginase n=1 Tax=Natrarchaeobius chitinivorans TaxID=1679083 RepID=A0A3N6MAH7_NATCH|nr:asparaginase [Natrarchaeobius chitinivorans]RQG99487.1 asparaginase [Natrarchaeobius chitinivorans]